MTRWEARITLATLTLALLAALTVVQATPAQDTVLMEAHQPSRLIVWLADMLLIVGGIIGAFAALIGLAFLLVHLWHLSVADESEEDT